MEILPTINSATAAVKSCKAVLMVAELDLTLDLIKVLVVKVL